MPCGSLFPDIWWKFILLEGDPRTQFGLPCWQFCCLEIKTQQGGLETRLRRRKCSPTGSDGEIGRESDFVALACISGNKTNISCSQTCIPSRYQKVQRKQHPGGRLQKLRNLCSVASCTQTKEKVKGLAFREFQIMVTIANVVKAYFVLANILSSLQCIYSSRQPHEIALLFLVQMKKLKLRETGSASPS